MAQGAFEGRAFEGTADRRQGRGVCRAIAVPRRAAAALLSTLAAVMVLATAAQSAGAQGSQSAAKAKRASAGVAKATGATTATKAPAEGERSIAVGAGSERTREFPRSMAESRIESWQANQA